MVGGGSYIEKVERIEEERENEERGEINRERNGEMRVFEGRNIFILPSFVHSNCATWCSLVQ